MSFKNLIIAIIGGLMLLVCSAQARGFSHEIVKHAHNDYKHTQPLFDALSQNFGSVEADVFLVGDSLFVAHNKHEITVGRTLRALYLEPLKNQIQQNNGSVYGNGEELILFVDIKADALKTYKKLHRILEQYAEIISTSGNYGLAKKAIRVVVSGERPLEYMQAQKLRYAGFDGRLDNLDDNLSSNFMPIVSDNWNKYFKWDGTFDFAADEQLKLNELVTKAHQKGYLLRFWGTPNKTEEQRHAFWELFVENKVDLIGTDHLKELNAFVETIKKPILKDYAGKNTWVQYNYKSTNIYPVKTIKPSSGKKVKNVILMIADGMGISHFSAAWIANRGHSNIDNCMYAGLVKTYAVNKLITDSGAAGSAMATGAKGNYHSISVDENNNPRISLTDLANEKGLATGIVVTCGLTDATPATFCGNNEERDNEEELAADYLNCGVDFIFGGGRNKFYKRKSDNRNLLTEMDALGYEVCTTLTETLAADNNKVFAVLEEGQLPLASERGDLFLKATGKALEQLSKNENGFFAMIEGSRIDDCGHWNDLPKLVQEIGDFDRTLGQVLEWAEKDGETLVIILADHETGGISIVDGDISKGEVSATFANKSHSGILVPVYTYGPQSAQFTGIIDNTDIFKKIKAILNL